MKNLPLNGVLKNESDLREAADFLQSLGLPPHPVLEKCWDGARMVDFIRRQGGVESRVLDVGCIGCPLLHWLSKLGFKNLYGCDLSPFWSWRNCIPLTLRLLFNPRIHFSRQNLEHTRYPSGSFDFITSLSVIEHGVSVPNYLREMSRLLKPGGVLLTSTDYWPEPIDTRGIFPFGPDFGEMKIFNRESVAALFHEAEHYGLKLEGPIDFSAEKRMVSWADRNYTFILFALRKVS